MEKYLTMKNALAFCIFILLGAGNIMAQSPGVSIISDNMVYAPALPCVPVMDTFTAVPVNAGSNPTYIWVVDHDTVGTGPVLIYPTYAQGGSDNDEYINGTYYTGVYDITLYMTTSSGTVVAYALAVHPPLNVAVSKSYACNRSTITYNVSTYNVDTVYWGASNYSNYDSLHSGFNKLAIARGSAQNPTITTFTINQQLVQNSDLLEIQAYDALHSCLSYYLDTVDFYSDTIHQSLCIVTIDSATGKSRVIWDKAARDQTDSFYLYRKDGAYNSATYPNIVAAIAHDALSEWVDASANNDLGSYGYAISVLDTCGGLSDVSSFYYTIFLTQDSGNFSWTPYVSGYFQVGYTIVPGTTYSLYKDATGNGNWQFVTSVMDTTAATDPNYTASAHYKILISLPNSCNPSRGLNTISSNIVPQGYIVNGIANVESLDKVTVSPNPFNDKLSISNYPSAISNGKIAVTNVLGQIVYNSDINGTSSQINTQSWQGGVYFVTVSSDKSSATKKVVK